MNKQDLTHQAQELHVARARSEIAEETFRLLVESVKDYGIFMLDLEGVIKSWNLGASRIKGYSADEVIGNHFSMFYTQEDRDRNHPQHELEIANQDGRYEEEGWRVRKDGTKFWANIVITHLVSSTGQTLGFSKVTRDLTERKAAEDRLKMANEGLERRIEERTAALSTANDTLRDEVIERKRAESDLQKAVHARDEFLSIASHELRTPITPLKMQLQGLLLHLRKGTLTSLTPERLEKMAGTIDRSLDRMGKLIDSLLDVARINAGKIELHPEPLDIEEVVRDTCGRFTQEAKTTGSEITVEIAQPIHGILDRTRLEQVITNLVVNSIKYGSGKAIAVSVKERGGNLHLEVKDKGVGIAEEDYFRIFNRFEQIGTISGAGGLGLGLYITKQIIDAQGGKIRVESAMGQGSKFTVELPLKTFEAGQNS